MDESYVTVGLTIYDKSSGKKCGAVLADIDTEIIYNLLDTTSEIAAFLIVDTDNQVLLESNIPQSGGFHGLDTIPESYFR